MIKASMSMGRCAYRHDMRLSHKNNVDSTLSKDNIVICDQLQGRTIEEYTNEIMQPEIEAYNAAQKRKDRQIKTSYVEYHKENCKNVELMYETVIQFGEHENLGEQYYNSSGEEREALKKQFEEIYRGVIQDIQNNYKHINVLYAVIHFDEKNGTPHLHVGFQGIGDKYKIGLGKRISIGNALTCDGIERITDRAKAKEEGYQIAHFYTQVKENYLYPRVEELGYTIDRTQAPKREHLEPDVFIQKGKKADELLNAAKQTVKQINERDAKSLEREWAIQDREENQLVREKQLVEEKNKLVEEKQLIEEKENELAAGNTRLKNNTEKLKILHAFNTNQESKLGKIIKDIQQLQFKLDQISRNLDLQFKMWEEDPTIERVKNIHTLHDEQESIQKQLANKQQELEDEIELE